MERLESSDLGRALISALIITVLICLAATNLPESNVRRSLFRLTGPLLSTAGLDQNWSVFAPNPPRTVPEVQARVRYADGKLATWRMPVANRLVGAYWDVYWFKWRENVIRDEHKELWRPAAAWIARTERKAGRKPVAVTLIRRWYRLSPPGSKSTRGPWQQFAYYTYYPDGRRPRKGSGT